MENVHSAFLSHLWGLGKTHAVHMGKPKVDFLVITELFSLGVTAEALRVDID